MFWFNKSIKELATYSYKLKSTEKEAVQNLFQLYFKDGLNPDLKQRNVKLSFNAKDKQLVNNNEIAYLKALYEGCEEGTEILSKINECLAHDYLSFNTDNYSIINHIGACAQIQLIEKDNEMKILKRRLPEDNPKRIANEYDILLSIKNKKSKDHVIQVSELVGEEAYYMEAADDTLESFILDFLNKDLSIKDKYVLILDILDSIYYLHDLGYLHRDLHPGNIFHVNDKWKVGDFGFAINIYDRNEQAIKSGYGHPDYVSPEQLRDLSSATFASEIYSIGKIINFILTKNPKNRNHFLSDVVEKCTYKDPYKRYQSILELKQALTLSFAEPNI